MRSTWKRMLSALLTIAMIATLLVVPAAAASPYEVTFTTAEDPATDTGRGTDNYFKLHGGKVEASNGRTFGGGETGETEWTSSGRYNTGGGTKTDSSWPKNTVEFTTKNKNATVKIWFQGSSGRTLGIYQNKAVISTLTVDTDGKSQIKEFTLANPGTYYIGMGSTIYIHKVVVTDKPADPTVTVTPATAKVEVGKTTALAAKLENIPEGTEPTVSWSSSAEGVATVNGGVVTGVSEGTAEITASITVGEKTYSGKASVEVVAAGSIVYVTGVTITGTTTVTAGGTTTLTAAVSGTNDQTPEDATVTWSSDNEDVATVSDQGVVTGVAAGTANITATSNGDKEDGTKATATVAVTVKSKPAMHNFDKNASNPDGANITFSNDVNLPSWLQISENKGIGTGTGCTLNLKGTNLTRPFKINNDTRTVTFTAPEAGTVQFLVNAVSEGTMTVTKNTEAAETVELPTTAAVVERSVAKGDKIVLSKGNCNSSVYAVVWSEDACTHTYGTPTELSAATCSKAQQLLAWCTNKACLASQITDGNPATGEHKFDETTGECETCDLVKVNGIAISGPTGEGEATEVSLTSDLTADVTRAMTATVAPTAATNAKSLTWKLTDKSDNALTGDAATDVTIAQDGEDPLKAVVTVKKTAKSGEYKVVASIDDGSVVGTDNADKVVTAYRNLVVKALEVTGVSIDDVTDNAKTVTYDQALKLAATVRFADNGVKPVDDDQKVTWSSSNTDVAEVAADGTVDIHKAGQTNIIATSVKDPTKASTALALTVTEAEVSLRIKTRNRNIGAAGDDVVFKVGQPGDDANTVTNLPADVLANVTIKVTKDGGDGSDLSSSLGLHGVDIEDEYNPGAPMKWNYQMHLGENTGTETEVYTVTASFLGITGKYKAATPATNTFKVVAPGARTIHVNFQTGEGGKVSITSGQELKLVVDAMVEKNGSVVAEDTENLAFAWKLDGKALTGNVESECTQDGHTGHRESTYTVAQATKAAQEGTYTCTVSLPGDSEVEPNNEITIRVEVNKQTGPAAPTAVFEAGSMTLSSVTDTMEYSVDGGTTWTAVATGATTATLDPDNVNQAKGIQVREKETAEVEAGTAQTIALTRAGKPNLRGEDKAIVIVGWNSAYTYQLKKTADADTAWANVSVVAGTGTGEGKITTTPALENGTSYSVRVVGKGTVLESEVSSVTPSEPKATAEEKAELKSVIDSAVAAKADVASKPAGTTEADVAEGTEFVLEADMTALTEKLNAASDVFNNADATKSQVAQAKEALSAAITAFEQAKKTGTKEQVQGSYVLDANDLEVTDNKVSLAGKAWGTEGFITVCSKDVGKPFTPESNMTFDGKTWTKTITMGGGFSYNKGDPKAALKFTTAKAATIKVWWANPKDTEVRNLAIYDSQGKLVIASTASTDAKMDVTEVFTYKLANAGTYYLGSNKSSINIYRIELEEEGSSTPATKYDVSVTGGTADKAKAAKGESVKITATVPTGKVFEKWTATGITLTAAQETTNPLTITMPEGNVSLTASFKDQSQGGGDEPTPPTPGEKTYTITCDTAVNGTVRADKAEAKMGDTITVTATPAAGYELDAVSVKTASGKSVTVTAGKFTMPGENVTVSATFKTLVLAADEYAVTCDTAIVGGAVSTDKAKAKAGDTVTVTATADAGYELEAITVKTASGKSVSVTAGKFTMPGEGVTVSATFKKTGDEPTPPTTVDKTAFDAALAAAKAIKTSGVKISTDGSDVATTQKWVTQAVKDALVKAIADAEGVKDDATQAEIDALTKALEDAVAGWQPVAGTKKTSSSRPSSGRNDRDSSTVKDEKGNTAVKTKDGKGNTVITVTAPDGETVAKVELPATVPSVGYKFVDVPEGHWAEKSINDLAGLGMIKGVNEAEHIYDMASPITRGSVTTILFRLSQGKTGLTNDFTDVAEGAWYTDSVSWAAKHGVVTGFDNGVFKPTASITREQLAVMLYRYAKLLGMDVTTVADLDGFVDASGVSAWASDAMRWAVAAGIIQGTDTKALLPGSSATRAQTACMIDRFVGLMK